VNLLLLAIAFRLWSGSALSVYLRLMAAIAVFSVEMQLATWSQTGTIQTMRLVNLGVAALSILWHAQRRPAPVAADEYLDVSAAAGQQPISRRLPRLPPLLGVAALVLTVTSLALLRPVTAADPYHLHRVDQITGRGTLAYDPGALDIKINALTGVYELLLADLRIPGMATAFVRLHGLFGLGLYLLGMAAVVPWIQVRRRWLLLLTLVVPVVFHQLVLVKNDLFGAMPAFVALSWIVLRGRDMTLWEVAAAAGLAGFTVGVKISSAPIAMIVALFVLFDHRSWRAGTVVALAGLAGAVAGGLLFTLVANQAVYGGAMRPYFSLGNRHETLADSWIGVVRFAISLLDVGLVTPRVWPGRGGWGSTLGLPLVWALLVLALRIREPVARRALVAGAVTLVAFAAVYPDADLAHRMVIAPGLLMILVALGCVDREDREATWLRRALVPVLALSAVQIARSSLLYLQR
jgi:hypothetical protein